MVDWTVEIETSRAIAAQILRHRSFNFQEFSQRYATVDQLGDEMIQMVELRPRAATNRQGSDEVNSLPFPHSLKTMVVNHLSNCKELYRRLIEEGVAPECARMVLPLATTTRLYMKGSVRSWIHYFAVRASSHHAQKEHRVLAEKVFELFERQFPTAEAAATKNPG
jgi:thymidylate synthase (FAD)